MHYLSTRGGPPVTLEQAIMGGTAANGGLYVPTELPTFNPDDFRRAQDLPTTAEILLSPFFARSGLAPALPGISAEALNFPTPLRQLEGQAVGLSVLELFHGPTAAFKDVGARFLAGCMQRILDAEAGAGLPVTIVVATSGDTGAAVAAAFHRRPRMRVLVMFPAGRVSPRQQHQLTCWGDNVTSLAVRGEFDDCQRLAKALFANPSVLARHRLASANSINVGRLLPQAAYYAAASLGHYFATGVRSSFIIPTGNLGNAFACVWARRFGMPIDRIVLATNANRTITDYLATGQWLPRPSVPTLASAMDVGDPSNMERLRSLCADIDELRSEVTAVSVADDAIRETIRAEYQRSRLAWCPHTATAFSVYRQLSSSERQSRHWVVVATAHAAKFEAIVEPLIGESVAVPTELNALLQRRSEYDVVDASIGEVQKRLQADSSHES